jgi:hypothetical protein
MQFVGAEDALIRIQFHPTYRILIAPARFRASSAFSSVSINPFNIQSNTYLSVLQLLLVVHNQVPGVSNAVAPLYLAFGQSECERPRQTQKERQVVESEGNFNLEQKRGVKILTCCLLPRLVITVKFIVPCPLTGRASESSSFSSTRFLRMAGGRTADSQRASAVFLSTFRDSVEVSVTIFANSLSNSASASSEGPRCSWRLLLADSTTSWSGEGGRSST